MFWITDGFLINHLTVNNKPLAPLSQTLYQRRRDESHMEMSSPRVTRYSAGRGKERYISPLIRRRETAVLQKTQKQQQNPIAPLRCWKEPWAPTLPHCFGIWICFSKVQVNQGALSFKTWTSLLDGSWGDSIRVFLAPQGLPHLPSEDCNYITFCHPSSKPENWLQSSSSR